MSFFVKSLAVLSAFSSACAFAFTDPMPAVLCVDAESYWDGPYTVEVTYPDTRGHVMGHVYDQSPEGRFMILEVYLDTLKSETELIYSGQNFKLEIANPNPKKPNLANITFKSDYGVVSGQYACLFFENNEEK